MGPIFSYCSVCRTSTSLGQLLPEVFIFAVSLLHSVGPTALQTDFPNFFPSHIRGFYDSRVTEKIFVPMRSRYFRYNQGPDSHKPDTYSTWAAHSSRLLGCAVPCRPLA